MPLYGLNSAFRAIPILGPVLGGRQGEGLVGITFAIKGKLDDPSVLVNPMSVMTPGIFRQIFEFTGTVPDAAAAASSNTRVAASPPAAIAVRDLHGPDQCVALLAERELDHAFRREVGRGQHPLSSVTATSFTLIPPPLIWRRASPVD